ncbi:hypothetical protein ANTQUA_LOCUS1426 [Anthophora quadrimaculata]
MNRKVRTVENRLSFLLASTCSPRSYRKFVVLQFLRFFHPSSSTLRIVGLVNSFGLQQLGDRDKIQWLA